MEKLGRRIQSIRILKKMTQEELASRIDKSAHFISVLERGLKAPKVATLIDIINALETTPNEVLCDYIDSSNDISITISEKLATLPDADKKFILKYITDYSNFLNEKSNS